MFYYLIFIIFINLFDETVTFPKNEIQKNSEELQEVTTKSVGENLLRSVGSIATDDDMICDDKLCNNHTCLGRNDAHICICKGGYSGINCEHAPCDSGRDCSGKGLCIGTSEKFTCMCQIGFLGERCEKAV